LVTNTEFAGMIRPLSVKTDKTIVMLDPVTRAVSPPLPVRVH